MSSHNFQQNLGKSLGIHGYSDRHLGLVCAMVLAVVSLWPTIIGGRVRIWTLLSAGVLLALSILWPALLRPLNTLWIVFGLLLGRVVNPVLTALLFFIVFIPAGLFARLLGKDLLRLKADPAAGTYWINRSPPGPQRETMAKQF
jgi:hypothetical protein